MTLYRTTNRLSPTQAGYLAGLIDGEGTIALARRHASENRQLVISISSTEPAILDYALKTIGAGKITRKRVSRKHHAPGLTYAIANRQALSLLKQVQPYLRSYKQERGALVLEHYLALTPRNGKYTAQLRRERHAFEEHFLGITTRRATIPDSL
jgi:hypothetical protein